MAKFSPVPIPMKGGLNVASSDYDMQPGECKELTNYEIDTLGRYRRVTGFERFDGKPSPSSVRIPELPDFPFDTDEEALTAFYAEIEARRVAILEVPGEGPVTGVFVFEGFTYAFRDNVGRTACFMYKSIATGWSVVTTPTLHPEGRYFIEQGNFTGASADIEIYGVDGKNPTFHFDGTTFTQITTDISPDAPTTLEILPSMVLLLGFRGGSFLFSGVGEPTKFSPVDGGGEIAVADEITEIKVQADATCIIACRNKIYTLYGTNKDDFQLKRLPSKVGMVQGTVQNITDIYFLDDRGITSLNRVQKFGDFDQATISQRIQPIIDYYAGRSRTSVSIKTKNQYRLFFDDGTAIFLTFLPDGSSGFTQVDYQKTFYSSYSAEDNFGREVVYVGGEDGFVYQLDRGTSFDGAEYADSLFSSFMNMGSPETKKKWHKLVVECDSVTEVTLNVAAYFDYMDPDIPDSVLLVGSGSKWDLAEWDNATWGGSSTSWADMYISGVSRNIAIHLSTSSSKKPPHIVSNFYIHTKPISRRR